MENIKSYINEKLKLNVSSKRQLIKVHSKNELKDIIEQRIEESKNNDVIYLNDIDVSELTNLTRLFRIYEFKEIHIENWDVSNVTQMKYLFPTNLTSIDLSSWDTDQVESMRCMFKGCKQLTDVKLFQNISNVKSMYEMFCDCQSLKTLDIPTWESTNLNNVERMFVNCTSLEYINKSNNLNFMNIHNHQDVFLMCKKLKNK